MQIEIHTAGKQIEPEQKIFFLHAGRQKIFFDSFQITNKVWMELPDLDVTGLSFDEAGNFDEISKKHIQRSRALANYLQGIDGGQKPPSELDEYHPNYGLGAAHNHVDAITFNAIKFLYFDAKKGDLVIVPGRGYNGRVIVGELGDKRQTTIKFKRWEDVEIPARNVKWIVTEQIRHKFSIEFVGQLVNPRALHILPLTLRDEIYDYVYGDWFYTGNSNFSLKVTPIEGRDNEISPSAVAALNLFVLYYGDLYDLITDSKFGKIKSFDDELHQLIKSRSLDYAWEGSIRSPGEVTIRVKDELKALFIVTLLSLSSQVSAAEIAEIQAETKGGAEVVVTSRWNTIPTSCDLALSDKVKKSLIHMNLDIWKANCQKQQEIVNQNLVIESNTTVSIADDDDTNE